MLACDSFSVEWRHFRNNVCYFFCNASFETAFFFSTADDLMKTVMMTVLQTQVVI
jgi:hypothetical protein